MNSNQFENPYYTLLGAGSPYHQMQENYTAYMQTRKELEDEMRYSAFFKQFEPNTMQRIQEVEPWDEKIVYANIEQLKSEINVEPANSQKRILCSESPPCHELISHSKVEPIVITQQSQQQSEQQPPQHPQVKSQSEQWPELSIDDINTSFLSLVNLQPNYKLKVLDRKNLVIDDSYLYMFRSEKNGQSRNAIISFLEHLLAQTEIMANKLVKEKSPVCILSNLIHNMSTFIHHFDKLKKIYLKDNTICVKLDVIHKNYTNRHSIIFRQFIKN